MKGQLFQLMDSEDFEFCLLWTNSDTITSEEIQKEFTAFYNDPDLDEVDADDFVEKLEAKYPEISFERYYTETINP